MTARLPVEEEEISGSERRFMHDEVSVTSARKHYGEVLTMAKAAAKELSDHLRDEGIERVVFNKDGSFDGLAAVKVSAGRRLINSFVWANVRLWLAAQQVCDVCELPDDGEGEGIQWDVTV